MKRWWHPKPLSNSWKKKNNMLDFSQLADLVRKITTEIQVDEKATPKAIVVPAPYIKSVCLELAQNSDTYFDMLSCLTGIDNGAEANTMEVVYNLYSIPFNHHLMLKVTLSREKPEIDSVCEIWRTA